MTARSHGNTPGLTDLRGWLLLGMAVASWVGFNLSVRAIGASTLTAADAALLRFGVPAVLLLPWLPTGRAAIRHANARHLALIAAGAGLPFFLLAAAGGKLTSASHVTAMVAGTTPLSFYLLGWVVWGEQIGRHRIAGLAGIVVGIALLMAGLGGSSGLAVQAAALLLSASLLWGAYTQGLRRAALSPVAGALVVTYPSFLLVSALLAAGVLDSRLLTAEASDIALFSLAQGIGAGIVSPLAFAAAIRRLGADRSALAGALVPVLVTILAIPVLGEQPSALSLLGVVVVTFGVLIANRSVRAP